MSEVGFVGLGTMGSRMAVRLLEAGHALVVQSRTTSHAESIGVRGGMVVATPAAVSERCDVVHSCLLNTDVVEAVYGGPDGLLRGARTGQVFVEHGTFAPRTARKLARAAESMGAAFVDAPVSGGPEGATTGALVCMVGGNDAAVARVDGLLHELARDVVRVGGPGTGLELKLVNQLLVAIHIGAAAEAATLVARLQLSSEVAERVLTSGWGASSMLARSFSRLIRQDFSDSGSPIGALFEVLSLVDELRRDTAVKLEIFRSAFELFRRAEAAGLHHLDISAVIDVIDAPQDTADDAPDDTADLLSSPRGDRVATRVEEKT